MKKYLTAIALTIALPAMASAQTAAAKPGCCAKMKDMAGCKDMAKMDHKKHDMKAVADPHAGHAMPQAAATAPLADAHQNHK